MVGGGQQHVADLVLRQVVDADILPAAFADGIGAGKQLRFGVADDLRVHDRAHPVPERLHVQTAVVENGKQLGRRRPYLGKIQLVRADLQHGLLVRSLHVDDLRNADVLPGGQRQIQIAHRVQRAVQRADGRAGDHMVAQADLLDGFPHADLVGAFCASALQRDAVGPAGIDLQFHVFLSLLPDSGHAGMKRIRLHAPTMQEDAQICFRPGA